MPEPARMQFDARLFIPLTGSMAMTRNIGLILMATAGLSALGCSSIASAAEQEASGFYVGAAGGISEFDDDGWFQGLNYDDSDSSYGVYAGYKFFKYFAVEARYVDLGFDASVFSGHAVGIIPFGTSGWELFGQLGAGSVDLGSFDSKSVGSAGLGVRFYPTSHLGISIQTDAYVFEEHNYNPSFGATQLAVHYQF